MVHWWGVIYGFIVMWIALCACFYNFIKNKTEYKGNTQGDMDMGIITALAIFLGPILFLFLKQIRLYRKHLYLKRRIRYYKWQDSFNYSITTNNNAQPTIKHNSEHIFGKEINRMERILKISKLHQKSKRRKIFKIWNFLI